MKFLQALLLVSHSYSLTGTELPSPSSLGKGKPCNQEGNRGKSDRKTGAPYSKAGNLHSRGPSDWMMSVYLSVFLQPDSRMAPTFFESDGPTLWGQEI